MEKQDARREIARRFQIAVYMYRNISRMPLVIVRALIEDRNSRLAGPSHCQSRSRPDIEVPGVDRNTMEHLSEISI